MLKNGYIKLYRSLLDWEPRTELRDGLRQIIDYYRPRLQDYL